jgi:rhamnose transport system permease protein
MWLFRRWEFILLFLLIAVFIANAQISPYFLDVQNLFDMTFNFMEKGLVALVMSFVIITGNVDLSVASTMAMSAAVMGVAFQSGLSLWWAVVICVAIGGLGGLLNGLIITKVGLPAIVVTLGTYILYRGVAYVLLGDTAVTGFPPEYGIIGQGYLGLTPIPLQLIVFAILAVAAGCLLHYTVFGRWVYAIGSNEQACRYSSIPVDRVKITLFVASGLMSALAAILLTSRIGSIRPNIASGFELEIITCVVLGGVSMSGGTGNMIGVVMSLFLVGLLRYGMGLLNIPGQVMTVVVGVLLIVALLMTRVAGRISPQMARDHT